MASRKMEHMSPMRSVAFGAGDSEHIVGGESVLFRHQDKLVNRTLYAASVSPSTFDERWSSIESVDYERIGERMYVEALNLVYEGDAAAYAALVKKALGTGRALVLQCADADAAREALAACKGARPLLNGANASNLDAFSTLVAKYKVPLGVSGANLSELYDTVRALEERGCHDLVLDVGAASAKDAFANAVRIRRGALVDGVASLGYPSIVNVGALAPGDSAMQNALASLFTMRYGSIVVLESISYAEAIPLYGLRQSMFTDPQRPMRVEPGVYSLNGADMNAVCCTTVDFALTYYTVSGELERSGVPVNMVITDTGGYSVMTAWAAGKLSAQSIADYFNENGLADSMQNKTLILPGKVAMLQGELEQLMPDWDIVVGPDEATDLVRFMKSYQ